MTDFFCDGGIFELSLVGPVLGDGDVSEMQDGGDNAEEVVLFLFREPHHIHGFLFFCVFGWDRERGDSEYLHVPKVHTQPKRPKYIAIVKKAEREHLQEGAGNPRHRRHQG